MSSSFRYTLTKLRSLPCSLYKCPFNPACFFVRSASSSPTVAPSASTASFLSVYGRSGVGIRIFVAIDVALIETGSIVFKKPHRHGCRLPRGNSHDDVVKIRPRMIEIELRRPRRMIGMRVIEPEKFAAQFTRPLLRHHVVGRPHEKP